MSLTEVKDEPKTKRKTRRKRVEKAPKQIPQFAGISALNCCAACSETGCVISGKPYCAHPFKGGLQGADLHDAAAVRRVSAAKGMIGKKKIKVGEHP